MTRPPSAPAFDVEENKTEGQVQIVGDGLIGEVFLEWFADARKWIRRRLDQAEEVRSRDHAWTTADVASHALAKTIGTLPELLADPEKGVLAARMLLSKAAKNKTIDLFKSASRRATDPIDVLEGGALNSGADPIDVEVDRRMRVERVLEVADRDLSSQQRDAIRYGLDGYTDAEIAQKVEAASPDSIKASRYDGKRKIKMACR